MDQDAEAFRAVFANAEFGERSVVEIELVDVLEPEKAGFRVIEILSDGPACIAVGAIVDASFATRGGGQTDDADYVVELVDGQWGYSWVGEGWTCDGPHPFSD